MQLKKVIAYIGTERGNIEISADNEDTAMWAANIIKGPAQPAPQPRPFDLEAAKAGAPLVTRDGRAVQFLAHDAKAPESHRVLGRPDGWEGKLPAAYYENGKVLESKEQRGDLFMAPKPKRTVWVNLYTDGSYSKWDDRKKAKAYGEAVQEHLKLVIAAPIEIDA